METKAYPTQLSLKWFEIWRLSFLHPTLKTFSRISSDPKVSVKWGLIWAAVAALLTWIVGPPGNLIGSLVMQLFGLRSSLYFYLMGAPVAVIFGILILPINSGVAHGLARLFKGTGTFQQLFFCWDVMQPPFILLAGLIYFIPSIFPSTYGSTMSTVGIGIRIITLLIVIGIYLYLIYAQVMAFSALEDFGFWKGLGVLLLQGLIFGVAGACLSSGFQALWINTLRPY